MFKTRAVHFVTPYMSMFVGPFWPKQRFKSQRLQDANATKSQTLAFYESQRFSATKCSTGLASFLKTLRAPLSLSPFFSSNSGTGFLDSMREENLRL